MSTLTALFTQRSEGERVMMAFEMFDMARAPMTADIRAHHVEITNPNFACNRRSAEAFARR